jgi:hypothetical protein
MAAAHSFETLVPFYQMTWHHIPEVKNPYTHTAPSKPHLYTLLSETNTFKLQRMQLQGNLRL